MSIWTSEQERQVFGDTDAPAGSPRAMLDRSRVDVIGMIADGIPDREYIPGSSDVIPRRKRLHIAADAKTGKSLAFGIVTALDIVQAGGTVVILDRENGADEYARRLQDVLAARGADDSLRETIRERLHYHAWPTLRLDWREDPDYPAAFADVDAVIFDSSRSHLTPLGLKEDSSDDFAAFTTALIDPLMQAGASTMTLDNTGYSEKDRARGTSAKIDLCDIAYTLKAIAPFSTTLAGRLQLSCTASRIGEITIGETWHLQLGDGHYGTWDRIDKAAEPDRGSFRPTNIMQKVSKAVEATPGLTRNAICTAVGGRKENTTLALQILIAEYYIRAEKDGQAHHHHSIRPYREGDETPTESTEAQPRPNRGPDPVGTTGSTGSPPYGGTGPRPGATNRPKTPNRVPPDQKQGN